MGQFLETVGHQIPSFVGIKFTSANLEEGAQALHADHKNYVIFLGNDKVCIKSHCNIANGKRLLLLLYYVLHG